MKWEEFPPDAKEGEWIWVLVHILCDDSTQDAQLTNEAGFLALSTLKARFPYLRFIVEAED